MGFAAVDSALFFSRHDSRDIRLGDIVKPISDLKNAPSGTVIVGYPDDEGIAANGGRIGASGAPDRIRRFLYRMTPPVFSAISNAPVWDLGNLETTDDIKTRHQTAEDMIGNILGEGLRFISFGGGHDYGYPDAAAFCTWCESRKIRPLVLNFDAHLDVRPLDRGITSGTPFYRLLSNFSNLDFVEVGIQGQCNSREHLLWLKNQGGQVLPLEALTVGDQSPQQAFAKFMSEYWQAPRPCFLSIDIDCFSSAYAPGCSQSFATGFDPQMFFSILDLCFSRLQVLGMGIYEVSPPLDQDDRTSKLAAQIAHRMLFSK